MASLESFAKNTRLSTGIRKGFSQALVLVLGLSLGLAGCSDSGETFPLTAAAPMSQDRVEGTLARSSNGAVALLDLPLPSGFTPLADATVQVVGSSTTSRSDSNGRLDLAGVSGPTARLLVTTETGSRVIEVPVFSTIPGPIVGLRNFPPNLALLSGETAALRTVGVNSTGRFAPVQASQETRAVTATPAVPFTTSLAERPLLQGTPVSSESGYSQVVSTSGGLQHSASVATYSEACVAMLSGQVLDSSGKPVEGALVQVEGTLASYTTGSDGRYQFDKLPPVPSRLIATTRDGDLALGFAPLTSRLLTLRELRARSSTYSAGPVLPVAGATGLAARPNRDVYVCQGSTLTEFTPAGKSVPPSTPTPPLQAAVGVAADFSGEPYIADNGANALIPGFTPGSALLLSSPAAISVDSGANIVALTKGGTGISYAANVSATSWTAPQELGQGLLTNPTGIAASPDGTVLVCDAGSDQVAVLEITQSGRQLHGDPNPSSPGTLRANVVRQWPASDPLGIAVGPDAEVYLASAAGVICTDAQGKDPIPVSSNPALGPVTVDKQGTVWVAESDGVHGYLPATPSPAPPALPAPTGTSLLDATTTATLDQGLLTAMQQFGFVGANVAISVNGRLVLERGYGYSQLDSTAQTPAQPGMLFRLASCSKTFTGATALLQMQDYATFTPDLKPFTSGGLLAGGVPGYDLSTGGFADSRQADISILNLLQMTAALDNSTAMYAPLARTLGGDTPPASAIEILTYIFSHDKLARAPGSGFVYSDVAYMTLGRVIEAVAKGQGLSQTYATFVQNRLLTPLGITDMRLANTRVGGAAPNEVSYYPYTGEVCGQSIFSNSPDQVPATYGASYDGVSHDSTGGWIASATDLVKLANALSPNGAPPGFANPLDSTRQTLFKALPTFSSVNRNNYYSAGGWFMTADASGTVTKMTKDGGLPGTTTYVEYQLQGKDQVVFSYLLNSRAGPGSKRSDVARTLFQAPLNAVIAAQSGNWPSGNLFP